MTTFQLKLLAALTMLIDHIGAVLFPDFYIGGLPILRIIGRLAFPIYCFLIAEGFQHTSDVKRYAARLAGFTLLSEIPFDLAFRGQAVVFSYQNVYFTLLLGLLAIWASEYLRKISPFLVIFPLLAAGLLAEVLRSDYGGFGVALIMLFHLFRQTRFTSLLSFSALNTYFSLAGSTIQQFASAACIPLALYNGRRGYHGLRYGFYAFYPVHLLLLYLINRLLSAQ